jgi:hypothetical protein
VTLQQTLIEPAKRSRAIDQVDLKDPVSNAPQFIEIAHGLRISGAIRVRVFSPGTCAWAN